MTQEQIEGFGFAEILQAVASIFQGLSQKPSNEREKRRMIKQAEKSMRQLHRWLKKDGWTEVEKAIWDTTLEDFAKKIKEL